MPMETLPTTGRPARMVRVTLGMAALLLVVAGAGCSSLRSEGLSYGRMALPYDRTRLGTTTSLDVLNFAHDPAYRFSLDEAEPVLLTQSDTAIAYSGRSADDRKTWLNLVVFDEFRMTAGRKYFFCIDERATGEDRGAEEEGSRLAPLTLFSSRKALLFDGECLLPPEVLTTPYATEEAQKIALVRWLAERFKNDMTTLVGSPRTPTQGNRQLTVSRMMVNQLFHGILTELAQSPGLAKDLGTDVGIPFPHASLGEGRLRLLVGSDIVVMTVRINLPLSPLAQ
ncbi:MAG: hypothetical protein FJ280_26310 [Planctomycetes bacterium]|nr:hypothetical protein [Planctomycetota bacterium]